MIVKLIQKENIEIQKHQEIGSKIFRIFTEQVSLLNSTKDVADRGRLIQHEDAIVSTFTQQLYILSLSVLQSRKCSNDTELLKFQNMLQAYVETSEKILEELQGDTANMTVDSSGINVDFTKLGVTQYEEVRPTLRSVADGSNVAKKPMSLGTKITKVQPIPTIELLRETTPEDGSETNSLN